MGTEKKYKYIIDLLLQSQGFTNNMNKVQSQMKGVESMAKKTRTALLEIGGALGFSYGIGQMAQLIKNSVELAAKAEGVKTAFNKIDNPNLLRNLRAATNNTVSDLELMAKTVQARNFKISMEALPTYFKFASQRAIETGQAVDYLVESLVVGVGRKSVLWLDNLGLSVTEINEELKKTPDFAEAVGKVIEREMKSAGTVAETTATSIQSITASWENLKVSLGESILAKGGSGMMGVLSDWVNMMSSKEVTSGDKIKNWIDTLFGGDNLQKWKTGREEAEKYFATLDKGNTMRYILTYSSQLDSLDEEGKLYLQLAVARYKEIKAAEDGKKKKVEEIRTLESINEEIQLYNDLILKTNVNDKATIKAHYEKINALQEEKKAIEALGVAKEKLVRVEGPGKAGNIPGIGRLSQDQPDNLAGGPRINEDALAGWKKWINEFSAIKDLEDPFGTLIDSLAMLDDALMQGGESWKEYAGNIKSAVGDIIAMYVREAVAAAIAGAVKTGAKTGPLAAILIPTLAAAAAGVAKTAFNSLLPKMAEGGLAYGPTVAEIGEYPGAKVDPEVISPLSKLKGMIQGNQVMPSGMKLGLDGQGNLYAWLKYKERHLSNYK